MSTTGRESPKVGFERRWPYQFSKLRHISDARTYFTHRNQIITQAHITSDDLGDGREELSVENEPGHENFFRGLDAIASPVELKGWKAFSQTTNSVDICRGSVWLDDRCAGPELQGSGFSRPYQNPLTAIELRRAWEKPRFGDENLPDASRRMVCITGLNFACFKALTETASYHQMPVLKDAIYKYLKFQTSIEVKLPSAGFLTFQLHLHLPFLVLRSTPPKESIHRSDDKALRQWTDLSFLQLGKDISDKTKGPQKTWGMLETQVSVVVTGSDDPRWVVYGFVDSGVDDDLDDQSKLELSFDPIAGGELEANLPIWRPRDYWIKVFEIRVEQVRIEWENLIHMLESGIDQYTTQHLLSVSEHSGFVAKRASEVKEAVNVTHRAIVILRRLDGLLSKTIEAWNAFNRPGGDIYYFYATDEASISQNAVRSLNNIKAIFIKLEGYQRKVVPLRESCVDFQKTLELLMKLEEKEAAYQNGLTSEFNVLVLYPIALAAAIFSMQPAAIPFDQNPKSFGLAIFILIVVIYAIRMFIQYALPYRSSLLGFISFLTKREKIEESNNNASSNISGWSSMPKIFSLPNRGVSDEESNIPTTMRTREANGSSDIGLQPLSGTFRSNL